MKPLFALIVSLAIWAFACKEDEDPVDPVTASLLKTLDEELVPLSPDPMLWTNDELQFLDAVSDHAIVGLGEATHGSAEFFKAKHRILNIWWKITVLKSLRSKRTSVSPY